MASPAPLVSVVTPTWQRHEWLLERCIASVQAQTYPLIEHVIVCDGPDPGLGPLVKDAYQFSRGSPTARWPATAASQTMR